MKKIALLFVTCATVLAAGAQTKTNATTVKTVAPKVTPTVEPFYFETKLVQGKMALSKAFKKTDGQAFIPVYAVVATTARASDNSKSFPVTLSQSSFESVFASGSSEMIQKLPALKKYISDNNITMTDEKGWIAVIRYYNNL